MADIKISALGAAGALGGTEAVPIVQAGVTVKATTGAIAALSAAILLESGEAEKTSAMTAAGALTGAELVPIVQGGVNVKTTLSDIKSFVGSGGGASVVQSAVNAGTAISTVTLPAPPTAGNLLVCFCAGASNSPNTGDNWQGETIDGGGDTDTFLCIKVAGVGESATQTPVTVTRNWVMGIIELSPVAPGYKMWGFSDGLATTRTVNVSATSLKGLIVGMIATDDAGAGITYPNLVPGTKLAQGNDVTINRSITLYAAPATAIGNAANAITAGFAVATDFRLAGLYCG